MTWIQPLPGASSFESVLAHRPELLARYRSFYQSLRATPELSQRTLELCRLRVAAIHSCMQEWSLRNAEVQLEADELQALWQGNFAPFHATERAALAVAEQLPFQHHNIADAEVATLRKQLGSPATVALLTAIAFFDVSCRLKLTLEITSVNETTGHPNVLV